MTLVLGGREHAGLFDRGFGAVHPAYNPYFSACFFNQNNVFLSQQISQQYFSAGLGAEQFFLGERGAEQVKGALWVCSSSVGFWSNWTAGSTCILYVYIYSHQNLKY
jgi:hypothetical protein